MLSATAHDIFRSFRFPIASVAFGAVKSALRELDIDASGIRYATNPVVAIDRLLADLPDCDPLDRSYSEAYYRAPARYMLQALRECFVMEGHGQTHEAAEALTKALSDVSCAEHRMAERRRLETAAPQVAAA